MLHDYNARSIKWVLAMAAFFFAAVAPASAQFSFEARVIRITDGDTLTVRAGERNFRVRLHGVDAPERGQAFGTKARDFLADAVAGKAVALRVLDVDRYGRLIAEVLIGTTNWNLELLRAGLAWHYAEYDDTPAYRAAEAAARASRRGLWTEPAPEAPWEYRRKN